MRENTKITKIEMKDSSYGECDIQLAKQDFDINLYLPNRQRITLQFRTEYSSLDICLPEICESVNWIDDDLTPSTISDNERSNMLAVKQICINLPQNCTYE